MAVPYEQMSKYAVIARLVALDNGSCAWHITRAPTSALKACQTTRVCDDNTVACWGFAEVGILACCVYASWSCCLTNQEKCFYADGTVVQISHRYFESELK